MKTERMGNATLYNCDCRELLANITGVSAVVTDPPYGEGVCSYGDSSVEEASDIVMGTFRGLHTCTVPGAYSAVFWTMRNLDWLIDSTRFTGWHYVRTLAMQVSGNARPSLSWVPRLQPILISRKGQKILELHDKLSVQLHAAIAAQGLTCGKLAKELGCDSRLVMKWSRYRDPAWCLPTPMFWAQLKQILDLGNEFDDELLCRTREKRREPRKYARDLYMPKARSEELLHPAQKPLEVVEHIVSALTEPGDVVLDPFMGSGTTAVACIRTGRKFIGAEIDDAVFSVAVNRLSTDKREFGCD